MDFPKSDWKHDPRKSHFHGLNSFAEFMSSTLLGGLLRKLLRDFGACCGGERDLKK